MRKSSRAILPYPPGVGPGVSCKNKTEARLYFDGISEAVHKKRSKLMLSAFNNSFIRGESSALRLEWCYDGSGGTKEETTLTAVNLSHVLSTTRL